MMPRGGEFKFEIVRHFGVVSESSRGWNKELNLVSFNDAQPKYDIRDWDPNHEKMGKGVTLTKEELETLRDLIDKVLAE